MRQTDIYMDGLDRAVRNLAETPRIGRTADDLRPGLFRFHYQSHTIFYTIEPDRIVIRRILHARRISDRIYDPEGLSMTTWREFWDSAHSIYVSDRHKDVHYRDVAEQLAAFVPNQAARVLDHGCGEAIHADLVANVAREVILCDAAPSVRAAIAARFAANRKIKVIAPEEVEHLGSGTLDLIFANSLVQYLTSAELDATLAMWRRLLAPGGTLIVADVIPPDVGKLSDGFALLRYAAANGFLFSAVIGLTRTVLSPYLRIRSQLGIARYQEAEFFARLRAAGFSAERLAKNVEHNPARMTFRAQGAH